MYLNNRVTYKLIYYKWTRTKDILYEINILCDCPQLKQQLQHDEHVLIGPKKEGFGPWQIETKLSCQISQNSICLDLMEEFT